jgi:hypothetical protein
MKLTRILALVLALCALLCGCKEERIVKCDRCGKELTIDADSNMTDEWIIFCNECELEAFGGTGVVAPAE